MIIYKLYIFMNANKLLNHFFEIFEISCWIAVQTLQDPVYAFYDFTLSKISKTTSNRKGYIWIDNNKSYFRTIIIISPIAIQWPQRICHIFIRVYAYAVWKLMKAYVYELAYAWRRHIRKRDKYATATVLFFNQLEFEIFIQEVINWYFGQ
jgi:hypothetical protein